MINGKRILLSFAALMICHFTFAQAAADLLRKGNKVFIIAPGKEDIANGQNAIKNLNFWQLADNIQAADILVNFVFNKKKKEYKIYAEVSNARSGDLLFKTKNYNAPLKGTKTVIDKIVKKEIKPLTENTH